MLTKISLYNYYSENVLPFGMKEKKKYKVDQPLKRINWNKIQAQKLKENSFWVKANEDKFANDDLCKLLLENFSTKQTKPGIIYCFHDLLSIISIYSLSFQKKSI